MTTLNNEESQRLQSLISRNNIYLTDGDELNPTQVLRIKLQIKDYRKQLKKRRD